MLAEQIAAIRAAVTRLQKRDLDLPLEDVMLFRTLSLVGRSLGQFADYAMRPYGLAEGELRALVQLYSLPEGIGHPGALCAATSQSPATMTRTTDLLVERGLISREPSEQDRRRMILKVTPSGEALVRRILPSFYDQVRPLFSGWSSEARSQLLKRLTELAVALDRLERTAENSAGDHSVASAST
jgi:MarR family transcriptional regulator, negative regulator of the multidrug operon emrRAB